MIIIVAAMAKNRVIGKHGGLPWHYPEDLHRFKQLTEGKTVVMGRRTFESIVRVLKKPLPHRANIVVSRDQNFAFPGVEVYPSIDDAISANKTVDLYVIGGAEVYEQVLPTAKVMHLTHIDKDFEGDTYFPEFDESDFTIASDESSGELRFVTYERK